MDIVFWIVACVVAAAMAALATVQHLRVDRDELGLIGTFLFALIHPGAMLGIGCLAVTAVINATRQIRLEAGPEGCCRCGYDLSGVASDICPECGAPVE
jgi:hypothetical protein